MPFVSKFHKLCLEGTTASKRRSVTRYEVPGIGDTIACLPGGQYLVRLAR